MATQLTTRASAPDPDACWYGCFAEQLEWSADGSRLFFATDWTPNVHIWSMAPDGTDKRQVTFSSGWEGFPGVSPDGSTVAFDFTSADESRTGIGIAPVDGSAPHTLLTTGPKRGNDSHPQYSPDGAQIAYQRFTSSTCPESGCAKWREGGFGGSIWIMNADGSNQRRITAPGQVWADPQWSPDGSKLLIQTCDEGPPAAPSPPTCTPSGRTAASSPRSPARTRPTSRSPATGRPTAPASATSTTRRPTITSRSRRWPPTAATRRPLPSAFR